MRGGFFFTALEQKEVVPYCPRIHLALNRPHLLHLWHMKTYLQALAAAVIIGTLGAGVAFAQSTYNQGTFGNSIQAKETHVPVCPGPVSAGDARCHAHVALPTQKPGSGITSTKPVGYGPKEFRSAYNLTGLASNGHPIIAIVDAYDNPYIQNDLNTYSQTMGIPSLPACIGTIASSPTACFKKVNQSGTTSPLPRANSGWALEIALDVQVAHAVCQNCSILLVEASSNSYDNLIAAVDQAVILGASVVSNSYGSNEFSGQTAYDGHFNHAGVAFTVSSGDNGYGAEYPASSPYVTAVGGTTLYLNGDGTYNSESVWSGTGSGCSSYEAKPTWQHDGSCTNRTVADVSADADPGTGAAIYDSYGYSGVRGWFKVGGTSLSAPLVGGVYALSGNTSGAANSIPYANATATTMHDVTSGSNGSCGGSYLCTALTGYDGPTGLGTPLGILGF